MKNLKSLGEILTKAEQQSVNGGHNCIGGCPTNKGCRCVSGICQGIHPACSP